MSSFLIKNFNFKFKNKIKSKMDERASLFGNKVKTNWSRIYSSIFITTLVLFTLWMFFIFTTVSDGDLSSMFLNFYILAFVLKCF